MEIDRQNRISLKLAEEGEQPTGSTTETAPAPAADGGEEG